MTNLDQQSPHNTMNDGEIIIGILLLFACAMSLVSLTH